MTQTPTQNRSAARLEFYPLERLHEALEPRKCNSCFALDGFMIDNGPDLNPDVLCPACSQKAALSEAAQIQLERLLIPVVRAWAIHWGKVLETTQGYSHPAGILEAIGDNFREGITRPALEGLNLPK